MSDVRHYIDFFSDNGFKFIRATGKRRTFASDSPVGRTEIKRHLQSKQANTYGVVLPEGIFAIDVDLKNKTIFNEIKEHLITDFKTFTTTTGSGGYHIYFKGVVPPGLTSSSSVVGGIEFYQGTGRHLIEAGSVIKNVAYKGNEIFSFNEFNVNDFIDFKKKHVVSFNEEGLITLLKLVPVNYGWLYQEWRDIVFSSIAFCKKSDWGLALLKEWNAEWREKSVKDNAADIQSIWDSVTDSKEIKITEKTIFWYANSRGYSVRSKKIEKKGASKKTQSQVLREEIKDNFNALEDVVLFRNLNYQLVMYSGKKGIYEVVGESSIKRRTIALKLRKHFPESSDIYSFDNDRFVKYFYDYVLEELELEVDSFHCKKESKGICCKNGVVMWGMDFKPYLINHSPDLFFKHYYDFDFNPLSNIYSDNLLHRFIKDAICYPYVKDDFVNDLRSVTEIIAHAIFSNKPTPKIVNLYGRGANGKSTFVEIIKLFAGADKGIELDEKNKMTDSAKYMANFIGKNFCVFNEAKFNKHQIAFLKDVSSVSVKHYDIKYGEVGEAIIQVTPFIVSNDEFESTRDSSAGIERRLLSIGFNRTFYDRNEVGFSNLGGDVKYADPNLMENFTGGAEAGSIFSTLVYAHLRVVENKGVFLSKRIKEKTRQVFQESNVFNSFMYNRLEVSKGNRIKKGELYEAYVTFVESEGDTDPPRKRTFFSMMRSVTLRKDEVKVEGLDTKSNYFENIKYKVVDKAGGE